MHWYLMVLRRYAEFTGRARRTEYWTFIGSNIVAAIILAALDHGLGLTYPVGAGPSFAALPTGFGVLGTVFVLAVLVPTLAVTARRLHDIGRSGWWQLIALIPLVGTVVLLLFCASDADRGPNRYGADPGLAPR